MKKIIGIILTVLGGFGIFFALIFGLIFIGVGVGFSGASNSDEYTNSNEYDSCIGTIVSTKGTGDSSSGTSSETVIAYTVDGMDYQGSVGIYSSEYIVGDTVTVYYEIANPNRFQVPELSEAVFGTMGTIFSGVGIIFAIIFGVVGLIMIIAGIVLIKSAKKDLMNS